MPEMRSSRALFNLALRWFPRQSMALAGHLRPFVHRMLPSLLETERHDPGLQELLGEVRKAPDPIYELNKRVAANEELLQSAGAVIRQVFLDRDPLFIRLCASSTPLCEPLDLLMSLYKGEYQGTSVEPDTLRAQWTVLENSRYQVKAADRLYFLLSAVRSGSLALVESILASLARAGGPVLPPVHKIGILRLVIAQSPECYPQWRARLDLTPIEALQAAELDARMGLSTIRSHAEFATHFTSVLPRRLSWELKTRVLPFYATHGAREVWMDCRLRADLRVNFLDSVKYALMKKMPWSVIRLGDGESYAWLQNLTTEQITMREQVWWGTTIEAGLRQQIAAEALDAITQADVLGVPALFRFARDTTHTLASYKSHRSVAGLLLVLDGVGALPPSSRRFTEERIHQLCFDLPTVLDLAKGATKVIVVSSIASGAILNCFSDLDGIPVDCVQVPTHTKTKGNILFSTSDKPLPYCYKEINQVIAGKACPGALVLVASGFIGKVFCETARQNGAVALDVGAMADYWVGVKTRSIADVI